MITNAELLGLTTAQTMAIDAENFEVAHRPTRKDANSGPFYLDCPLDAIEDVARGGYRGAPTVILFLWDHVIHIGEREWRLDGRLELWRKARAYARQLADQGLLVDSPIQGGVAFRRPEAVEAKEELLFDWKLTEEERR